MKHNPDNRDNNVRRIKKNIDMTLHNMELADEMIEKTSDENMKNELEKKNQRRRHALEGFRHEIKDEADYQKSKN